MRPKRSRTPTSGRLTRLAAINSRCSASRSCCGSASTHAAPYNEREVNTLINTWRRTATTPRQRRELVNMKLLARKSDRSDWKEPQRAR